MEKIIYSDGKIKKAKPKKGFWKTLSYLSRYLYVAPVLIGILVFTLIPMIVSLVDSFSVYDPTVMNYTIEYGFDNYERMFTTDWLPVAHSFWITIRYAILMVPLGLIGSFLVAIALNHVKRGQNVLTVILYLGALIPGVASTLLWSNITSTSSWGYVNQILKFFGADPYTFYSDPETVFPTIVILSLFGWGPASIMWTAQMKNISKDLYEAASIDGAGRFIKLSKITIPMCTPMLFYLLITNIIGALQLFGGYYALMAEYPQSANEMMFIVVKIYKETFGIYGTPYASAISWMLFIMIAILTAVVFKTSGKWVYYGEEK